MSVSLKVLLLFVTFYCVNSSYITMTRWSSEWDQWKLKHKKSYISEEEEKRQTIWQENFRKVMKHNYEYDLGKQSFRLGMNRFADMTPDEYKAMYLGLASGQYQDSCQRNVSFDVKSPLPETVDWRKKGYVTPVKDQGNCGSCWAFSATGSLEGQHFKKTGTLVSLSEQNLVDCSFKQGDMGCNGGMMTSAFQYVLDAGGIDTEKAYPYHATNENCHFKKADIGATVTGCVDIPSGDENALKAAVAKIGPISVAIDAGQNSFQLYKNGVYFSEACSSNKLDHGVLVVGYGTENGEDYWLVKNSWGKNWGIENGYIKMARNRNNNCGIASLASYPLM